MTLNIESLFPYIYLQDNVKQHSFSKKGITLNLKKVFMFKQENF